MHRLQLIALSLVISTITVAAQEITVEDIIDNYLENTGGTANWRALKGIRMTATLEQQGVKIPLEIVQLADGRQYTKFTFQGKDIFQSVYDGKTLWGVNAQTMKAEKSDPETFGNFKLDLNDFPDSFLDYRSKGYEVQLLGTEIVEGTKTYKVQLTKEPRTMDGQVLEDVKVYYFHSELFLPLAQEAEIMIGPQTGNMQTVRQGEFDEVDGLYFPFSLEQGIKGGPMQPINIRTIEVNPVVDDSVFAYPGN